MEERSTDRGQNDRKLESRQQTGRQEGGWVGDELKGRGGEGV